MSIKNTQKELKITFEEVNKEDKEIIYYRQLIQKKTKELNEIKYIWKEKIETLKNLKTIIRTSKQYLKTNKKTRNPEALNGFTKPVRVEEKLENFLNLNKGTYTTRNFIWKNIYFFIKENNLLSEQDKRKIIIENDNGKILKELLNLDNNNNNIYSIRKNIETLIIKE